MIFAPVVISGVQSKQPQNNSNNNTRSGDGSNNNDNNIIGFLLVIMTISYCLDSATTTLFLLVLFDYRWHNSYNYCSCRCCRCCHGDVHVTSCLIGRFS